MRKLFLAGLLLVSQPSYGQAVNGLNWPEWFVTGSASFGNGKNYAPSSAWLSVGPSGSKKGFRGAIGYKDSVSAPVIGLEIFDLPTGSKWIYSGTSWVRQSSSPDDSDIVDLIATLYYNRVQADARYVQQTVTVNSHPLSGNVTVTKSDVGLGNADNTSDANKPVSTATATALSAKEPTITPGLSSDYLNGDKVMRPLLGIPIPTLVQTALDTKEPTISEGGDDVYWSGAKDWLSVFGLPISDDVRDALDVKVPLSRTINGHALSADVTLTKTDVDLANVDNTSDVNKPISTATQVVLDVLTASNAGKLAAIDTASLSNRINAVGVPLSADSATNPSSSPNTTVYYASQVAQSYDNFLNRAGSAIQVTSGMFSRGEVHFVKNTTFWDTSIIATNFSSVYLKSEYTIATSPKNLFNKADTFQKRTLAGTSGAITPTANATDVISKYIPVSASTSYILSRSAGTSFTWQVSYFRADSVFISGVTSGTGNTRTLTTPANTAYLVFQVQKNTFAWDGDAIQLELGSTATNYFPYQMPYGASKVGIYKFITNGLQKWAAGITYEIDEMVQDGTGRVLKSISRNNSAALNTASWKQEIADQDEFLSLKTLTYTVEPTMRITYDTATKILLFKKSPAGASAYIHVGNGTSNSSAASNKLRIGVNSSLGWSINLSSQTTSSGKPVIYGVLASDAFWNGTLSGNEDIDTSAIVVYPTGGISTNARAWRNFVPLFVYDGNKNVVRSKFFEDGYAARAQLHPTDQFWYDYQTQPVIDRFPAFKYMQAMKHWQLVKNSYTDGEIARLVMYGNSIFARWEHTTNITGIDTTRSAPGKLTSNLYALITDGFRPTGTPNHANFNYPDYYKWDAAGIFTETGGSWATQGVNVAWDDVDGSALPRRCVTTRMSNSATAAFSFVFTAAYERFNLIDKASTVGTPIVTVSVAEGNGVLQARMTDTSAWQEANGFVFSQLAAASSTQRRSNVIISREVQFKKVGAGIGAAQTISFTNGSVDATKYLCYTHVECVKKNKTFIKVVNTARGGQTIRELMAFMTTEVIERRPDLLLFEVPVINDVSGSPTGLQPMLDSLTSFFNIVKAYAGPNWDSMSILVVIPHNSAGHFLTSTGAPDTAANGMYYETYYKAIEGLLIARGDIPYIKIQDAVIEVSKQNFTWNSNVGLPLQATSETGNSLTKDGTHLNNKGSRVEANWILPAVWYHNAPDPAIWTEGMSAGIRYKFCNN